MKWHKAFFFFLNKSVIHTANRSTRATGKPRFFEFSVACNICVSIYRDNYFDVILWYVLSVTFTYYSYWIHNSHIRTSVSDSCIINIFQYYYTQPLVSHLYIFQQHHLRYNSEMNRFIQYWNVSNSLIPRA